MEESENDMIMGVHSKLLKKGTHSQISVHQSSQLVVTSSVVCSMLCEMFFPRHWKAIGGLVTQSDQVAHLQAMEEGVRRQT